MPFDISTCQLEREKCQFLSVLDFDLVCLLSNDDNLSLSKEILHCQQTQLKLKLMASKFQLPTGK